MKKVAGIGIYEQGKFQASIKSNGLVIQTKAYKDWVNLCSFAGNGSYTKAHPSYLTKTLHSDWIKFQSFAEWHSTNYIEGWFLSTAGSDLIGPDTSWFVPAEVRSFVTPRRKPLLVGKNVQICMVINSVECKFGKYKDIPEAMKVYAGLFQHEAERLSTAYDLSDDCLKYLLGLSTVVPQVRFV